MYQPARVSIVLDDMFQPSTPIVAHHVAQVIQRAYRSFDIEIRKQSDETGRPISEVLADALSMVIEMARDPDTLVAYMFSMYVYFSEDNVDKVCTVVITMTANAGGITGVFVDIMEVESVPIELVCAIATDVDTIKERIGRRSLSSSEIERSLGVVNLIREGINEAPEFGPN